MEEGMKMRGATALLFFTLVLAACGGDAANDAGEADSAAGAGGAQSTPSIGSAPAASAALIAEMRPRLNTLRAAGGDEIPALVPEHTRMVHDLLTAMNAERTASGRTGPAAWDATRDSVEQDLVRMQTMSQAELEELMEGHTGRLERLMDMHSRP
jgi:hypothetical protein